MSRDFVNIAQARDLPGLRLVMLRGLPSPWSQAARGIFDLKQLDYVLVERAADDAPDSLETWTGQDAFPAAVYGEEKARSGWAELLFLAERLAPKSPLIPEDPADRALFFGLCHEVAGEMGLGWCRRLVSIEQGLARDPNNAISKWLGNKYGYSPEAGAAAGGRVIDVLTLLRDQLGRQQAAGRRYLIGESLSALDIYWATFCNLVSPLPPDQCAIPKVFRGLFTAQEPEVIAIAEAGLLAHRDFIYTEHLELPVLL